MYAVQLKLKAAIVAIPVAASEHYVHTWTFLVILSFFVTFSTSVNIHSYLYSRLLDECTRENARAVMTDSEDTQHIDTTFCDFCVRRIAN